MFVGPSPERPTVFPVALGDRQIVDRSKPSLHHACGIELPVLVSVGSEPVAAVVVPLISEPHRDSIVGEGPQFLDQAVVEFLVPLACEKGDDLGAPIDEFRPVAPPPVLGVSQTDSMRVSTVPRIFRHPDLNNPLSRANGGIGAAMETSVASRNRAEPTSAPTASASAEEMWVNVARYR